MDQAKYAWVTRLLLIPVTASAAFSWNSCYVLALLQSLLFKVHHGQQKEPDKRF